MINKNPAQAGRDTEYAGGIAMNPGEKAIKELMKYIEQHEDEITDEESQSRLVQQFMEEYNAGLKAKKGTSPFEDDVPLDADYYMELADEAASKKKRMEYLKKALELEPDNVDAQLELIMCDYDDKPHERLKALEELLKKEAKRLEQEGYYEDAGEFWSIFETRPFMRTHASHLDTLINLGMMRPAIEEAKEMLRLCENDNLGIRYCLMHLYAYMEDEANALALHKQYDESDETQMLLPLSILYYKLGEEEKAENYLHRLAAENTDTKKFMTDFAKHREETMYKMLDVQGALGYRPFTYDEFLIELSQFDFLFISAPSFPKWALQHLPKQSSGKKSQRRQSWTL